MERIRHSPCHNVRPGTRYPATLVVTGNHDTRVMPAHSFKFVAALQAAQAGSAPFLLRVQLSAGTAADQTRARLSAKEPMLTPSSSRPWG
jgi:prolyl oligopeptidase